jgi:pimeloyl-ACP methyl ester carboxylesterase
MKKRTAQKLLFILVIVYYGFQYIFGPAPVPAGRQQAIHTNGQRYYWYVPEKVAADPSLADDIVAVIHGYTGQDSGEEGIKIAQNNLKRFTDYADETNSILIAPHFSEDIFDSDYQRFNLDEERSDSALIEIIEHVRRAFPNVDSNDLSLFGFSGGGQFVHRFCAFHPELIKKAVASGAGWYMWPDDSVDYPVGLDVSDHSNVPPIDIRRFLECNILVLIGDEDITQGSFREEYKGIDLNDEQGDSRLERAIRWVDAIEDYADRLDVNTNIKLRTVPDVEHKTSKPLMREAFKYLKEDDLVQ